MNAKEMIDHSARHTAGLRKTSTKCYE